MLDLTDWQNKKFQTRDGRPVRILCVDAKGANPIIGLIQQEDGTESVEGWFIDGRYFFSGAVINADLINAKTKREGWVNVSKLHERDYRATGVFFSKEKADMHITHDDWSNIRIACVRIEWEE